jgi:hypothetical protein
MAFILPNDTSQKQLSLPFWCPTPSLCGRLVLRASS